MKKRTGSLRRHYEQKLKRRCQTFIQNHYLDSESLVLNPRLVGRLVRTRKPCSCFMCGNPRKYFNEKTMGEIRQG